MRTVTPPCGGRDEVSERALAPPPDCAAALRRSRRLAYLDAGTRDASRVRMTIAPGLLLHPRQLAFALACGLGLSWFAAHAPPPPRSDRAAAMRPPLCLRSAPAVESLGPTHYRVSRRAFAQLYSASQTRLPHRGFRVVPSVRDSRPSGVRVYAVAPRSLVAQLGITNGDLIERVNAIPMISPDHILAAYAQVQTASQVRVDLLRGAIHVHLVYELVD
jgi:hypothetical protein